MKYAIVKKVVDADTGIESNVLTKTEMDAETFVKSIFALGGKRGKQPAYKFHINDLVVTDDEIVVSVERDYRKVSE